MAALRTLFAFLLLAALGLSPVAGAAELEVVFVDVGQGDAVLVFSPAGKTVLIDAGPAGGAEPILAELRARGVKEIDLALLSHPHQDHVGGMAKVLEAVPARFYMDPGVPHPAHAYARLLSLLEERQTPVRTARAGRRVNLGGGAALTILAPEEPLLSGTRSDVNANSAVVRITYGRHSVLLTGDAEQPTEARLRARDDLRSTVLKVAHHGGRESNTPAFIAKVRPELAVISVGRNSYGHPSSQTIRRLETVGARVLRTDVEGSIVFRSDGDRWAVETRGARGAGAGGLSGAAAGVE